MSLHNVNAPNDFEEENNFAIWQEPRKEPLGAPKENLMNEESALNLPAERLHALEEQQEILSSSVFSLTSHLAQIEFRLRQIVKAPSDEKDAMLKALEEFTSKGVPHARASPQGSTGEPSCSECFELEQKITRQRSKQSKFIEKLKTQLKELEQVAAATSSDKIISSNQQRLLIDHLQKEIDNNLAENFLQPLTADELQHQINCAIRQYADRQISKEEIINKLQAHIEDMEKFIKVMKNDEIKNHKQKEFTKSGPGYKPDCKFENLHKKSSKTNDDLKAETVNLIRKASTLIQIFTVSQFGCSPNTSKVNHQKSSTLPTHWGNVRAKLEMSIDSVLSIVSRDRPVNPLIDSYDSESEEGCVIINDVPLTTAVRRHLATNLRDLLQHGLVSTDSNSLVPIIGCFPVRRSSFSKATTHFWEVILKYYTINNGDAFNSTPARKLSQSFNLDIVGGTTISNRQSLLSTIGSIVATHMPYKRSYDAHFKAFVCAGLNAHKLVIWLNIILKSKLLIDLFYSQNSYVVNTGFQDALQSLDRLTPFNFDLPVDLAVKQFQNIKDVFN